jgi:hypothetical protein
VTTDLSGAPQIYAPPRQVHDLAECDFYHTMEIPGHGLVNGPWDIRPRIGAYLGNFDFAGKRVLELGTADGYLTFEIERQGAEVVSYDLSEDHSWDWVPYVRTPPDDGERRRIIRRINNAYWLGHRAFGSRARMVYGDIYSVPPEIGPVDVAVFGALLLHVRDPFQAMARVLPLTTQSVVITDALGFLRPPKPVLWARRFLPYELRRPAMRLTPDWERGHGADGWWRLTPEIVQAFAGILGFERSVVTTHLQVYNGRRRRLFTVVAHRTVAGPVP